MINNYPETNSIHNTCKLHRLIRQIHQQTSCSSIRDQIFFFSETILSMKTEVDEFVHQESVQEISLPFLRILVFICTKFTEIA